MGYIVQKCPHCLTEKVSIRLFGHSLPPYQAVTNKAADMVMTSAGTCPVCFKPVAVQLRYEPAEQVSWEAFNTAAQSLMDYPFEAQSFGWYVANYWPAIEDPEAPEHTPEGVARVYKQAMSAYSRGELDAAAMLFRRTLELAVKYLQPDGKGSLQHRIDELANTDLIPEVVGRWAHEVRIVGNDAAHAPQEPMKHEVKQIAEFVDAFLQYVFTMAEKFRARERIKQMLE